MTPINTLATELHLTRQALIQKLKRLGFSSTSSGKQRPPRLFRGTGFPRQCNHCPDQVGVSTAFSGNTP